MATDRPPADSSVSVPPAAYRDLVTRVEQLQEHTRLAHLAVVDALTDALRCALLHGGFDLVPFDDAVALAEALGELHARLHDHAVRDKYTAALIAILAVAGTTIARDAINGGWRWAVMVTLGIVVALSAAWVINIERRIAAVDRLRVVVGDVQRTVLARVQMRVRVVADGETSDDVADSESASVSQPKRGEGSR